MRQDAREHMISHTLTLDERINQFVALTQRPVSTAPIPPSTPPPLRPRQSNANVNNINNVNNITNATAQNENSGSIQSNYRPPSVEDADDEEDKPPSYRSTDELPYIIDEVVPFQVEIQGLDGATQIENNNHTADNVSTDSITPSELVPAYSTLSVLSGDFERDLEAQQTDNIRLSRLNFFGNRMGSPPASSLSTSVNSYRQRHGTLIHIFAFFMTAGATLTIALTTWYATKGNGPPAHAENVQIHKRLTNIDAAAVALLALISSK